MAQGKIYLNCEIKGIDRESVLKNEESKSKVALFFVILASCWVYFINKKLYKKIKIIYEIKSNQSFGKSHKVPI